MEHSKYTREQEVKLKDEVTYKSAWYVVYLEFVCLSWNPTWNFICLNTSGLYRLIIISLHPYCVRSRKIQCFKQEDRLESEGMPVPVSHCHVQGNTTSTNCQSSIHVYISSFFLDTRPMREY